MRNSKWIVSIALLLSIGTDISFAAKKEHPRILHAKQEVDTARTAFLAETNETLKAAAQERYELAKQSESNLIQFLKLKDAETEFVETRETSADYGLRETLSTINTSTNESLATIAEKNKEIRRLKGLRANLITRLKSQDKDPNISSRVRNIDAELMARTLERDTAELQLRLAREVIRVDSAYRMLDLNPRPTLKLLHQKHQNTMASQLIRDEFSLLQTELQTLYEQTSTALDLAEQQQELIVAEIASLQKQRERAKRNRDEEQRNKLDSLLNDINREKDLFTERLRHIPAQHAALDDSLDLVLRGQQLFDAEVDFLREDTARLKKRYLRRITLPLFLVLLIIGAYTLISRLLFPLVFKKDSLFVARRIGGYVTAIIIILVLVTFFLEDLKAIATIMGIVGAAVVIALQDLCSSFAGWFVIVASRKLKVGDRVEIDGKRGDVIDIQMLRTTMLELNNWLGVDEPTGRIVIVPNSFIFKHQVFNYSHIHPFIWGNVEITVTFETPPEEAYELLQKILEEETKEEFEGAERGGHHMIEQYGLVRVSYEPHIHTIIGDSGVKYTLFYVTHYRRFSATRDKICARVLREFGQNPKVEFAYPTERHIPTPIN